MRIKVEGYLDSADLSDEWLDEAAVSGLSEAGYDWAMDVLISGQLGMHDIEITAEG